MDSVKKSNLGDETVHHRLLLWWGHLRQISTPLSMTQCIIIKWMHFFSWCLPFHTIQHYMMISSKSKCWQIMPKKFKPQTLFGNTQEPESSSWEWSTHGSNRDRSDQHHDGNHRNSTDQSLDNYYNIIKYNTKVWPLVHFLFITGPRCIWSPVYGSRCLYLPQDLFETLLMWLWLMMIPTQYDWWCQYKAIPGNL